MTGLIINLVYVCLIVIVSPVLLWKRIMQGKYAEGADQKLWGKLPQRPDSASRNVWFHAVSVGEVLQLQQVITEFQQMVPDANVLVTTTTQTGYAVAVEKFPDLQVAYFPMDFTWAIQTALQRVQPDLIVLVELELWPNLIRIASSHYIPLAIINGRLSENSSRGYRKIRPLVKSLLARFEKIAVQSEEYADRFVKLGCPPEKVVTTGSIKFDGVHTDRNHPQAQTLREWLNLQSDEQVLIAGSTQDPEEAMVLDIYSRLLNDFPKLRLILVPRHPERGTAIVSQIQDRGFSLIRRSTGETINTARTGHGAPLIGLLDTVGELGACWGLADIAFVGGSFGNRGGQNMLEPAAYGAATCFGPNTRNFKYIVELLLAAGGAKRVITPQELEQFIRAMLTDEAARTSLGQRAQSLVLSHQGATQRSIEILKECLHSRSV